MGYIVESKFAKNFDSMAAKLKNWRVVHAVTKVSLRLLLPVSWLGLLIAPACVWSLPFQILRACRVTPPSAGYWISAAVISSLLMFFLYRLARLVVYELRHRVLDVESLVGFTGFSLAAALTAYILPHGWF
jgi:hypothetical protein